MIIFSSSLSFFGCSHGIFGDAQFFLLILLLFPFCRFFGFESGEGWSSPSVLPAAVRSNTMLVNGRRKVPTLPHIFGHRMLMANKNYMAKRRSLLPSSGLVGCQRCAEAAPWLARLCRNVFSVQPRRTSRRPLPRSRRRSSCQAFFDCTV